MHFQTDSPCRVCPYIVLMHSFGYFVLFDQSWLPVQANQTASTVRSWTTIAYVQQAKTPFPNLLPVASSLLQCQNFWFLSRPNLPCLVQFPEADELFRPCQMATWESVKLTPQTEFSFPVAFGTILTSLYYQLVTQLRSTRQDENITRLERSLKTNKAMLIPIIKVWTMVPTQVSGLLRWEFMLVWAYSC